MIKKVYYIEHNYDDEAPMFPVNSLEEAWFFTKDNKDYSIAGYRWEYCKDPVKCNRKPLEEYISEQGNYYVVKTVSSRWENDMRIDDISYKSFSNLREAVFHKLEQRYKSFTYQDILRISDDRLVRLDKLEETVVDRITDEYEEPFVIDFDDLQF